MFPWTWRVNGTGHRIICCHILVTTTKLSLYKNLKTWRTAFPMCPGKQQVMVKEVLSFHRHDARNALGSMKRSGSCYECFETGNTKLSPLEIWFSVSISWVKGNQTLRRSQSILSIFTKLQTWWRLGNYITRGSGITFFKNVIPSPTILIDFVLQLKVILYNVTSHNLLRKNRYSINFLLCIIGFLKIRSTWKSYCQCPDMKAFRICQYYQNVKEVLSWELNLEH